jgi:hypothetical protein
MHSKVIACLLCLAVTAGTVRARQSLPSNADRLKKKIESVSIIYKQTLKRHYEELISSLDGDIKGLEKLRALGGTTEEIAKINADIERFTKERADAVEAARALDPVPQEQEVAAQPTPSPTPSVVAAQLPCGCPEGEEKKGEDAQKRLERVKMALPAGVIWCGSAKDPPVLSALTLAEHAAPILWFSPNEPLIFENKKLPEPLPGDDKDPSTRAPVVYYKITEMVLHDKVRKSEVDPSDIRLDQIKRLALKYYFYYSKDRGFGGHRHDLESVRLDINFALRNKDGEKPTADRGGSHYVAHISKVIGAAHGVTWYANQLNIGNDERDTSLPITLLVEEGKHATSPDRNADGFYSPGYDVNFRYTDAWGVRDLLGSGKRGSAHYEGAMTKPRRPKDIIKLRPDKSRELDEVGRPCLLRPYGGAYRAELEAAPGYKLTRAAVFETPDDTKERIEAEKKEDEANGKRPSIFSKLLEDDKISGWVEDENFREPKPRMSHGNTSLKRAAWFGFGIKRSEEFKDSIPIAYRAEGRQHGFTILPPVGRYQIFFLDGYFLPKLNFMFPGTREGAIPGRKFERPVRFSLEALYTPSASRTFDWYAAGGSEWARPSQDLGYEARFVQEGGMRFRVNAGSWLVGGRVGLRVTGFAEARSPRFIFEFGTGAF